jgi:hypothetical protein
MERASKRWIAQHPDRVWESLSIETRAHLMNINEMEIRETEEIRSKLLKTLDECKGMKNIKQNFENAIKSLCIQADYCKSV